jgi:hypothetical protein
MSNDIAEPRRTGRDRKQVDKFEPQRECTYVKRRLKLIDQEHRKGKLESQTTRRYVGLAVYDHH